MARMPRIYTDAVWGDDDSGDVNDDHGGYGRHSLLVVCCLIRLIAVVIPGIAVNTH
jgi:hypothetical protein